MEMTAELVLKQSELLSETAPLSPEKEAEYLGRIAVLEGKTTVLEGKNIALEEENTILREQLAWFKRMYYGQKSEKTEVVLEDIGEQVSLFNEAEEASTVNPKKLETTITVAEHTRKAKATHEEIFEKLPVEEVIHEVEDKTCPVCGTEMEAVGKEFIRDEVVYVPARLFVRKHYASVVKCPACGKDEEKDETFPDVPASIFKKAGVPAAMIPKSYCSPELLAHIVFEKICQGVPLYRQEKSFKAMGLSLSRTTMANWMIYAAKKYAEPIWNRMKAELLAGSVIHADETVVQVLHEPGKKAKSESRMWVYASPKSLGHSNVLFQYAPTRNGDHAARFLGDYAGYLVCDGYDGYNKLKNVTRIGCWAHARRKFVDALPQDKELFATSKAAEGVAWCNKLFLLEQEYKTLSLEEKRKARAERSKAVLDGFYSFLETVAISGGSKLAKAIQYAKNEKACLSRFLGDPIIPIDNNRAENAIRPFVIGRKNWLFSDSVKGAEASAMLYSLAVTATANGLNAEEYFAKLFSGKENIFPW